MHGREDVRIDIHRDPNLAMAKTGQAGANDQGIAEKHCLADHRRGPPDRDGNG